MNSIMFYWDMITFSSNQVLIGFAILCGSVVLIVIVVKSGSKSFDLLHRLLDILSGLVGIKVSQREFNEIQMELETTKRQLNLKQSDYTLSKQMVDELRNENHLIAMELKALKATDFTIGSVQNDLSEIKTMLYENRTNNGKLSSELQSKLSTIIEAIRYYIERVETRNVNDGNVNNDGGGNYAFKGKNR